MTPTKMTPEFLTKKFPKLYHLTSPDIKETVKSHGLLSPSAILDLLEIHGPDRTNLIRKRRPKPVQLKSSQHGQFTLSDNTPIHETVLTKCLGDELNPPEWFEILANKVFFFPSMTGIKSMSEISINRDRPRETLVFDTHSLLTAHWNNVCITPMNTGAAKRNAPRRGLSTFASPEDYDYKSWQQLRGVKKNGDIIKEVTINYAVTDASDHLVDIIHHRP